MLKSTHKDMLPFNKDAVVRCFEVLTQRENVTTLGAVFPRVAAAPIARPSRGKVAKVATPGDANTPGGGLSPAGTKAEVTEQQALELAAQTAALQQVAFQQGAQAQAALELARQKHLLAGLEGEPPNFPVALFTQLPMPTPAATPSPAPRRAAQRTEEPFCGLHVIKCLLGRLEVAWPAFTARVCA